MGAVLSGLLIAFAALVGLFEGPAQIACVLVIAVLLIRDRRALKPEIVELAIVAWMLAGVPGTLDDQSRITSEGALRPLLALAFVAGRAGIARADDRTLRRIGFAFVLACAINGAYGLLQVFVLDPPLERWIVGRARSEHLIDPLHPERLKMATGLFYNRLKLAHVGVLGLGLLGLELATQRPAGSNPAGRRNYLLTLTAAIILAAALLLTYRRAAPAALLAGSLVLGLALKRFRWVWASGALGGAILALYFFTDLGRERASDAGEAMDQRIEIYRAAWRMFSDHPLLGVGHGDYKAAIASYADSIPDVLWTSPHNLPLHVLAETGLIGFCALAAAIALSIVRLVRRVRRDRTLETPRAEADRFALLGLATLLTLGMFHSVLYHAPVALVFWALLGIAADRAEAAESRSVSVARAREA